jgi:NAD(P)-dependent dehydrogenase (short-subunit alcohol dehydrogenase family)
MQDKPVALITGANQGIGFQIAKDMAAKGYTVLLGARNIERGEVAAKAVGTNAVALQLDVTDEASITAAAARIRQEFGRLDVLIQNAAIASAGDDVRTPAAHVLASRPSIVSLAEMRAVWDTNVFGVLSVYQAMVPILRSTPKSRIVNVSSGAGSLTLNSDPNSPMRPYFDTTYAASKTALNALTLAMAIELEADGIKVSAVSPGYTNTKMNGFTGTDTVEQGAAEAVRVALGVDGPTGTFTHATMGAIPW